jgi:hypothetical protein
MSVEENEEEAAVRRGKGGSQEVAEQSQQESQETGWVGSPRLSQFQQGEGGVTQARVESAESQGGDSLAESPFVQEVLAMAEMTLEGLQAKAAECQLGWLEELPADLLQHLQESPCQTWRGNVESRRRKALGKALEPLLAAAVLGRVEGWKAIAVAMRLLCRAPTRDKVPQKEGRRAKDGEFHRRLELARAGEWRQLAREYAEAQEGREREAELRGEAGEEVVGGDGKSQKERAADRCCRLAQCGEWSRAAAAVAGPPVMGDQPGMAEALRKKILPVEEEERRLWAVAAAEQGPELSRRVAAEGTGLTRDAFEKAARTAARGSAQSNGGWRLEHVRAIERADGVAWRLLRAVGMLTLVRGAPAWWYEYLSRPRVVPFEKNHAAEKPGEPDPRPVGCVDPLWRWASRALMFTQRRGLAAFLAPEQYAVGQRAGVEAIAHSIEADELDGACEGLALLAGDVRNAFNSVSRAAILQAAKRAAPSLALAMLALYERPTTYLYYGGARGEAPAELDTGRGCIQGDPLSMALFCLALRAPVRWAAEAVRAVVEGVEPRVWADPQPPDSVERGLRQWVEEARKAVPAEGSVTSRSVKPRYFADDGVWQIPRWLLGWAPRLVQTCVGAIGLAVKPGSWETWSPRALSDAERRECARAGVRVKEPGEGMVVAGAKFADVRAMPGPAVTPGGDEFAKGYLDVVVKRAQRMCEAVAELPAHAAGAYPAHKIALRILVDCAKPRLAFFTRVTRPSLVRGAAKQFDAALWGAAAGLIGLTGEEAEQAKEQAARRPVDGGIGMQREERRCAFAFLGSWLDVAQALAHERDIFAETELTASPVGRLMRQVYGECAEQSAVKLPPELAAFLRGVDPEALERKYLRADKSIRWQALLMRGKDEEDAKQWLARADRKTKQRLAETGGAWVFAPDVEGCLLTGRFWQIAMRLRFGLSVRPAVPEGVRAQRCCQVTNAQGARCGAVLDDGGHHACACSKAGQQTSRHTAIVRELQKGMRRRGVWVREEQWVDELTVREFERGEGGEVRVLTKQAQMDLVVRDGARLWWVDFTCFHPFIGSGRSLGKRTGKWSLESREGMKHRRYAVRQEGRREVSNGQLIPIVANSYGALGREGSSFLRLLDSKAMHLGRECSSERLGSLVESLVMFFTAQSVLAAYGREMV